MPTRTPEAAPAAPAPSPSAAPSLPIVENAGGSRRPSADVRAFTVTGAPTIDRDLAAREGMTHDTAFSPSGGDEDLSFPEPPPSHLADFVFDPTRKEMVRTGAEESPESAVAAEGRPSAEAPSPTESTSADSRLLPGEGQPDDISGVDWDSLISTLPAPLQEKARKELADYREKVQAYAPFEGTIQRIKAEFGLSSDAEVRAREVQHEYDQRIQEARDQIDLELADEFDDDRRQRLSDQLLRAADLQIRADLQQREAQAQWYTRQRATEEALVKAAQTRYPLLSAEQNIGGVQVSPLGQTVAEYRRLMEGYILRAQTAQNAGYRFDEPPPNLEAMLTTRGEWLSSIATQERQKAEAQKQKDLEEYHRKLARQQQLPPSVAGSAGRGAVEVPTPLPTTTPMNFPHFSLEKLRRLRHS